ncbi:hypothetical protein [Aeromicrobium ginsengisoli]|uniref:hypothetical protein n=1 Tax=Aeromicrobium ginsengisoli TaxID=363867 RepID=UPI00165F9E81|nr:hypothetical protein [Aeromicrobium ginsengisoli]
MTDLSYAWRPAAIKALRKLAVATLAGAVVGFLVGGVGGRLIMGLLAGLNAEDAGALSDDGFTMGQVTLGGTLNLLLVGTVLGVLGGGIHLAVRDLRIGPGWFRAASLAVGAMVVVGAGLVHSDGVDFTLLEPTWAAIGLTLAIPFVFALALPPLADRWLRDDSALMTTRSRLLVVPLVPWVFPPDPCRDRPCARLGGDPIDARSPRLPRRGRPALAREARPDGRVHVRGDHPDADN